MTIGGIGPLGLTAIAGAKFFNPALTVAMEAVGVSRTFELCTQLIRPVGHVANMSVHGFSVTLHLETL